MSEQGTHETVGRYRLIRKLARGGMAEVYLARSQGAHGFEKTVAIKRILPHFASDDQFVRMMVDEAKISVLLSHPNVAQIFEFGEADGEYFLVMEYVGGQSLSKLVKRMRKQKEQMNVLDACYIVMGLLQGLNGAHTQKNDLGKPAHIIHRDVSPQNVLLSWNGHIKVIDFGIARARDRLERTEIGTIKGKLRYLAPEMIDPARFSKTKDFDHRVDIFAAGIVLYELVAGASLFTGENELEVYDAIMSAPIPDLAAKGLCKSGLMKIIDKALERNPDKRYLSAEDFADDLRAHLYSSDANYKSRRIAELMNRYFSREKEILEKIEREGSAGAIQAEREVNLTQTGYVADPQNSTRAARSSSGSRSNSRSTNARRGETGSRGQTSSRSQTNSRANRAAKHPVISGIEQGVTPDAETRLGLSSEFVRRDTPSETQAAVDETQAHMAPVEMTHPNEHEAEAYTPATRSHDLPAANQSQNNALRYVLAAAIAFVFLLMFIVGIALWPDSKEKPLVVVDPSPQSADAGVASVKPKNPDDPLVQPDPSKDTAATVAVIVSASPASAKITRVGSDEVNGSPSVFLVKPNAEIEVRVTAEGYESAKQKVSAPSSGQERLEITLRAMPVAFKLAGLPSGANATLDGKRVQRTDSVTPGKHVLVVTKSGYETYRKTFVAKPGERVQLSVALKKKRKKIERAGSGSLSIKTTPYWGRVTIDGKVIKQTTPVTVPLKAGSHKVTVTHPPKGLVKSFTIQIGNGDKKTRTIKW